MSLSNTKRSSRKAKSCPPDPAVRAVARRTNISPALALVVAELAGLTREVRHD
jgi:hypothetical protein